jgi:hypothetical protein
MRVNLEIKMVLLLNIVQLNGQNYNLQSLTVLS